MRWRERETKYFRSPFVLIGFPTVSRNPAPVSSRRRRQFPMKTLTSLSSSPLHLAMQPSSMFPEHTFVLVSWIPASILRVLRVFYVRECVHAYIHLYTMSYLSCALSKIFCKAFLRNLTKHITVNFFLNIEISR